MYYFEGISYGKKDILEKEAVEMLNRILIIILSITNFLSVKIIIEHKKEISE
jgi:hypothetical protein